MASSSEIPVVDFSSFSVNLADDDVEECNVEKIAAQIHEAFSTVGFVYLKNTGISDEQISKVMQTAAQFFTLPTETKKPYARQGDDNHGWICLERESLNPERPGDLKEAYNVTPNFAKIWPDQDVPAFKDTAMDLHRRCARLATRVLKTMAIGLRLKDTEIFHKAHHPGTWSTLRCLYYPGLEGVEAKPNQVRCGEHSDYGSITLLFQDEVGGLEVRRRGGDYVAAPPIPGTVVVNVGDLIQRWTSDRLVSTKHRVMLPDNEAQLRQVRQSLAFFVHPNDDFLVECLDGSNKYQPITGGDYLRMRFAATY